MNIYPSFYQRGPVCIKRESATQGKQVVIPETSRLNPYGFHLITTNDKAEFDSLIRGMKEVTFEVYEHYLIRLHEFTQRNPTTFRETHQLTPDFAGSFRDRNS